MLGTLAMPPGHEVAAVLDVQRRASVQAQLDTLGVVAAARARGALSHAACPAPATKSIPRGIQWIREKE